MRELNAIMEFDHVVRVHADGSITEPRDVYAPDLHDGELDRGPWRLMSGYSGQHGYSGPLMHQSEYVGGALERDIRATPGLYVALVNYPLDDSEPDSWAVAHCVEVPDDWPVKPITPTGAAGEATCGECERTWDDTVVTGMTPTPAARCPFEPFH